MKSTAEVSEKKPPIDVTSAVDDTSESKVDEKAFKESNIELSSRYGSICWLNMIASGGPQEETSSDKPNMTSNSVAPNATKANVEAVEARNHSANIKNPNNLCTRWMQKLITVFKWVFNDFRLRHLVWIKFIFFFQSASMTVLYPYLNLHMKSLGLRLVKDFLFSLERST